MKLVFLCMIFGCLIGETMDNEVINTDSGLKYKVSKIGEGNYPQKGDKVIGDKSINGWLRIVIPKNTACWISARFVKGGVITGDNVNVRCGAGISFSPLGKLIKGSKVTVFEVKNKTWARISAHSDLRAWVSGQFIELEPAKIIVKKSPICELFLAPAIIPWCAQVTVAPDVNKITVFNKGTPQGLKVSTPSGGHTPPNIEDGLILASKKAQKKAKKNIISEIINKRTPCLKPC